jgi:hypothetical protein
MSTEQSSSHRAHEATPLLSSRPSGGETAASTSDDASRQQFDEARFKKDKWFFLALLLLAIVTIALSAVAQMMVQYGQWYYDFWDSDSRSYADVAFFSFIFVLFTGANLIRLRLSKLPLPPLANVLVYCIYGVAFCYMSTMAISDRLFNYGLPHCSAYLDDPDSRYEGTLSGCQAWRARYQAVTWAYLIIAAIYGIVSAIFTIVLLTGVYRSRSFSHGERQSFWNLPAGQLSVEVAIRWGQPASPRVERDEERAAPTNSAA